MVLVTGCTGLLGKTLARKLAARGVPVRGFDLWKTRESAEFAEFIDGSILDNDLVLEACADVETIYHLLDVEYPTHYGRRFMKKVNIRGTDTVLRAAAEAGVKKVIFLSSGKVYGNPGEEPVDEDDRVKPNTPYGKDKVRAEKLCRKFMEESDLDITILRPTTITGPGVDDAMILIILYMALGMGESNRLYIAGEGDSRFQLIHPDDVADAMILAAGSEVSRGRTYNLGSDNVPPQSEQVYSVKEKAGLGCEIRHITPLFTRILSSILKPLDISYLRKEHVFFILSNFLLDCGAAKKDLGWIPQKDNIGIFVETIDWYRKEKL